MKLYQNEHNRNILESLPGNELIWEIFGLLSETPRESGNTTKIVPALQELATKLGYTSKLEPESNNILIIKPADSGFESCPVLAFQCHMDMVCEKSATLKHDFSIDPLKLHVDKEWLMATDTTLGADNGIGIAISLALMKTQKTGRVELLITTDEETSMHGAQKLQKGFCSAEYLVNVDSEDDGFISVGCAGGAGFDYHMKLSRESAAGKTLVCKIYGGKGGHSGVDIHHYRINAIKAAAQMLAAAAELDPELRLVSFTGGKQSNAIPREANFEIFCNEAASQKIRSVFQELRKEHHASDPSLAADFSCSEASAALSAAQSRVVIDLVSLIPHGVQRMSNEVQGQTESSNNMASITLDEELRIVNFCRSSIDDFIDRFYCQAKIIARALDVQITPLYDRFPGWMPNFDSSLLELTKKCVEEIYGFSHVEAGHYGLECAFILAGCADLKEVVSVGPTIKDPHSVSERLSIDSVEKCFELLLSITKGIYSKHK